MTHTLSDNDLGKVRISNNFGNIHLYVNLHVI